MRTLTPLFALSTLLAALPAQDKVLPFRFVPADSTVVLKVAGPGKWKQQFANTQIAKLLQGESLASARKLLSDTVSEGLDKVRESGRFDADLVEALLKDYAGEITVALHLDLSNLAEVMQTGETPPIGVVIALAPDASYDLSKLAAAIDKATEANAADVGPLRDLAIGDVRLRVATQDNGATTVPMLIDGHLVFLAGNDIDKYAAKVLGTDARFSAATNDASLLLHAQLDSVMSTFVEEIGSQVSNMGAPFDAAQIMRDLGLSSLTSMQMSMGNDGKHLTGEYHIGMKETDRGLLDLMSAKAGAPKLLRCVPSESEAFSVTPFQSSRLLEIVGKVWSGLGDQVPMTWEEAQASAADALKVRLQEDLFAHLGSEVLILQDPEAAFGGALEADEDENPVLAAMNGMCIGIALRDGKAFGESVEKMVRARGMHAARKTEEYQGTKVHKIKFAGAVDVEYAITDDVVLLGIGKDEATRRSLRSALDARASTEGGIPTAAKAHLAALADGWNGISCSSVASSFTAIASAMEARGEMPDEIRMFGDVLKSVSADLKRLGIDRSVSTTYSTANGLTIRTRW